MATDANLRPPISPIQPGAYSSVDASGVQGQGLPTLPIVCILGVCLGGPPNDPLQFRDAYGLKSRLRSGAAFDCARFAMAAGAGIVKVVRVGNGILQSTKSLAGATGTPVVLTSLDYGAWNNSINVTVTATNHVTLTYTDANGVTFTEDFPVGAGATAQQVVDAINGKLAGYPTASQLVSAAVGTGTMPLTNAAVSAMTAGSDGAVVSGDWTTALTAIEAEDVDLIGVASGDAAVHAQVQTHLENMSSATAKRERRSLVGAVAGETVSQQVTRMAALTSKRIGLAYPGVQDFDAAGVLKTYDPFYAAAKLLGMVVAQPDLATSILGQAVPCVDLEQQSGKYLSTLLGGDVDTLLRANVTPLAPAGQTGSFQVVDCLSAWKIDDSFRDFHKCGAADTTAVRLRTALEAKFKGRKALAATADAMQEVATDEARALYDEEIIRAYLDAQATPGTDQRTWNVSVPVLLPEATKYIMITVALQPSSTVINNSAASDAALI